MFVQPAEPMVFSLGSTVSRFSGFFYQCYLIPLMAACLVLSLSSDEKPTPIRTALRLSGTMAAAATLYLLIAPVVGDFTQIGTVSHILLMGIVILYAALFCRTQDHIRVILTAAILADINFAQSISTQILMPVMPLSISNLLQFVTLLVAMIVVYLCRPTPSKERIPTAYWLSMLVIAALSAACLYAIRALGGRSLYVVYNDWLTVSIILSAFFIVNLLIYYLYYVLVKEYRAASSMQAMQAKLEQDLEFYRRSDSVAQEYKALRHELKNHVSLMESLLREKQYDKLQQYFEEYTGKIKPALAEFRCPNPLISSIISHQMNTAQAAGVTLDVIAAVPASIGIADDDLCSVLSNMIDNGVEACIRAGKDLVKATLHTDKDCLFITVTNPVSQDVLKENPDLRSTKETASHGFGIPIIRRITEKYDGIVTFHMEEGWFTADAMMYMTPAGDT